MCVYINRYNIHNLRAGVKRPGNCKIWRVTQDSQTASDTTVQDLLPKMTPWESWYDSTLGTSAGDCAEHVETFQQNCVMYWPNYAVSFCTKLRVLR